LAIQATQESKLVSKSSLPKFFTVRQLAEALGVSEKTIRRAIKAGLLRAHYVGPLVRIAEDDAAMFMAQRRR
jgi:excisionase family DNA binding protein